MLKLYRTKSGVKEYWEAWATPSEITIHWGKLGEDGRTRELSATPGINPNETIERESKPLRAAGFKALKRTERHSVVIQYQIPGQGSSGDLDKRIKVEELMNDRLGWTGLGHCDGGDIGSGSMNIFCYVADIEIAESVIVRELKSNGLLDGAVIVEQVEGNTRVFWPHDIKGKFSVI